MPRKKTTPAATEMPGETPLVPKVARKTLKSRASAAGAAKKTTSRRRIKIEDEKPQVHPAERQEDHAAGPAAVPAMANEIQGSTVSEREQIALLAYSFWEARGYQGGSAEDDWLRAEREIRKLKSACQSGG